MAEPNIGIKIPRNSVIYIIMCLTGILVFLIGGIIPAGMNMGKLLRETSEIKFRIEEQKMLAPFHQSLQSKIGQKESEILPLPSKGNLSLTMIDTLPAVLRTAANISGLSLLSAVPNLSDMTGDARFMSVSAVLQGDFFNLRKFMINIGGIPYVQHIEEISIIQKTDTKEVSMKIWVAVG
jgi:hypothetical protein